MLAAFSPTTILILISKSQFSCSSRSACHCQHAPWPLALLTPPPPSRPLLPFSPWALAWPPWRPSAPLCFCHGPPCPLHTSCCTGVYDLLKHQHLTTLEVTTPGGWEEGHHPRLPPLYTLLYGALAGASSEVCSNMSHSCCVYSLLYPCCVSICVFSSLLPSALVCINWGPGSIQLVSVGRVGIIRHMRCFFGLESLASLLCWGPPLSRAKAASAVLTQTHNQTAFSEHCLPLAAVFWLHCHTQPLPHTLSGTATSKQAGSGQGLKLLLSAVLTQP